MTFEEAALIGATLKLSARRVEKTADVLRQAKVANAERLICHAARLDAFADRLYEPFVGADGAANLSAFCDE